MELINVRYELKHKITVLRFHLQNNSHFSLLYILHLMLFTILIISGMLLAYDTNLLVLGLVITE